MMAQERNGWQFDSLRANTKVSEPDAQQVYEVLLKMLDRWNGRDGRRTKGEKEGEKGGGEGKRGGGPHLVVGLFPKFEAYGGREHHDGSPKV